MSRISKDFIMATATMTTKGQVTIPLDVRQRLGLDAGDRIEFVELESGGYAIKPAIKDIRSLKGLLRKPAKPVSVEDMNTAVRARGAGR
jgi:antitoxin PrlF